MWRGSLRSAASGRPASMAQKRQALVQTSPKIIKVAVPLPQHSPIFGQWALSQTVCRLSSRKESFISLIFLVSGIFCLNQAGRAVIVGIKNFLRFIFSVYPAKLFELGTHFDSIAQTRVIDNELAF